MTDSRRMLTELAQHVDQRGYIDVNGRYIPPRRSAPAPSAPATHPAPAAPRFTPAPELTIDGHARTVARRAEQAATDRSARGVPTDEDLSKRIARLTGK